MVILSLNGTFWMSISPVSWKIQKKKHAKTAPSTDTLVGIVWAKGCSSKTARIQGRVSVTMKGLDKARVIHG